MKKILLLSSTMIFSLTMFAQDKEVTENGQIKENKVETIKIINGDTVIHEVRIVKGDFAQREDRMHGMRRHELKDEALSEELQEMIEQMDFYVHVDDNHKKMIVQKMHIHDQDVEDMLKSLEEDEDIIIDMKNGRKEMKVIKIAIDEDNGKEIKVIEMERQGRPDRGKGHQEERIERSGNDRAQGIKVFPNPVKDELSLEFVVAEGGKTNVSITDMNGKQLFNKSYTEPGNYTEKVRIDQNNKGLYIVRLESNDRSILKKIIID